MLQQFIVLFLMWIKNKHDNRRILRLLGNTTVAGWREYGQAMGKGQGAERAIDCLRNKTGGITCAGLKRMSQMAG